MESLIYEVACLPETSYSFFGAIVAGLGALAGGYLSYQGAKQNRSAQNDANSTNIQLAREQNAWNRAQWERENAYNHPIEQMRRLNDAGINPNLAFSNGTINNVSASSPQAAQSRISPYLGNSQDSQSMVASILTGLQAYEQYKQSQLQTKLGESQVDYLKADILNKRVQTEKAFEEKVGLSYDNYVKKELRDYNIDMFKLQMDEARANISLKNAQTDVHRMSLSYTQQEMRLIAHNIEKVKQETTNLKTTNEYTRQLIQREKLDNALRAKDINPSDPLLYRMLAQAIKDPDYGVQLVTNLRNSFEIVGNDNRNWLVRKLNDFVKPFTPDFLKPKKPAFRGSGAGGRF